MTKWEWESELRRCLSRLNAAEQERILGYYGELFDDKIDAGMTEEQITAAFGNPSDVAEQILAGYPYELHEARADELPQKDRPNDMKPEKDRPNERQDDTQAKKDPKPEKRGFLGLDFGARRTWKPDGDVRAVHIQSEGKVTVTRGDGLEVGYCESEYFRYEFSLDDGVLEIRYVPLKTLPSLFFMGLSLCGLDKTALYVTLPRDGRFDLDVETKNSKMRVDGGKFGVLSLHSKNAYVGLENLSAETLDVTTANAAISANALSGGKATFVTRNGVVGLSAVRLEELTAATANAAVHLDCVDVDGKLTTRSTNAWVKWENVCATEAETETTNAPVNLTDVSCNVLRATTTNGPLSIEKIVSDDITLKTTNGVIGGTVRGNRDDYAITSSTTFGENTIVEGGRGPKTKTLTATTTRGSIKIDFVE